MEHKNGASPEAFSCTYSAKQQEEVKAIRQKYVPREENKMDQLKHLDESTTKRAITVSLIVGILGALVMGTGMSLVMVWPSYMAPGIAIGCIGMAGVVAAYPAYTSITKKERQRLAPQIQALSDELLGQK